jgi:hypothetical protein
MRKRHRHVFDDWKVVWMEGQKKNVQRWEENIPSLEKGKGSWYSQNAWKGLENDVQAMTARWICSPNNQTALCAKFRAETYEQKQKQKQDQRAEAEAVESEDDDNEDSHNKRSTTRRPQRKAAGAANKRKSAPKRKVPANKMKVVDDNNRIPIWSTGNQLEDDASGLEVGDLETSVEVQEPRQQEGMEEVVGTVQDPNLHVLPEEAYVATDSDASGMSTDDTEKEQHEEQQHDVVDKQANVESGSGREESTDGPFASV